MTKKIILYTKSYCPSCVKAKQLLKNKNVVTTEIDITNNEALIEEMLMKSLISINKGIFEIYFIVNPKRLIF